MKSLWFQFNHASNNFGQLPNSFESISDVRCQYKRKEGSHHILTFSGAKRAVVIPEYNEIDVEIIKNNMRTVGMTREQFFALLNEI